MKCAILNTNFITIANALALPYVKELTQDYEAYLVQDAQGLGILIPAVAKKAYYVDFESAELRRRVLHARRELLVRACLVKPAAVIIDATAGFGRDSFILAASGAQVSMLERHPMVALLLEDGLSRIGDPALRQRLTLIKEDAVHALSALSFKPDVIYLDPMFEAHTRQAKVKKDLQLLQTILAGAPQDQSMLLPLALSSAKQRVVVKRAIHAAPLNHLKPSYCLSGKDSRFDVYQV
jgi:16S rRNA (guanine1516-N2)-methyltransferase